MLMFDAHTQYQKPSNSRVQNQTHFGGSKPNPICLGLDITSYLSLKHNHKHFLCVDVIKNQNN